MVTNDPNEPDHLDETLIPFDAPMVKSDNYDGSHHLTDNELGFYKSLNLRQVKLNKHWLFRKKFMTFYCHGGDESVDIGTFATGQELYDAINQYCNQYNCTPANVELECNGYNDEILKIYNFEGALDGVAGTKKIATDLTITIFKSSAFKTLSQTFKRRSTTTKSRLVSYTINGLSASASLKQFVDKTKLLNCFTKASI